MRPAMLSFTSPMLRLRYQPVEFADHGDDFGFQGRLIGDGGFAGGTVRAFGQRFFDPAERAFDAADGEAGFVEIEFHVQGLAALAEGCNRLSDPKCALIYAAGG